MATRRTADVQMKPPPAAETTTEADPGQTIKLQPGSWYIAAVDTSPIPVGLALDTIEEGLRGKAFGTIRFYRERSELPPATPDEVRKADANVWVSGQFVPPGGGTDPVSFVVPPGLVALGELTTKPPEPAPIEKSNSIDESVPTSVIVAAAAGVLVVGGGAIFLAWWLKAKRKRKNGRRRRRRK